MNKCFVYFLIFKHALVFTVSFEDRDETTDAPTETLGSILSEDIDTENATEISEKIPEETEEEISTEPPKTINGDVDIHFSNNVRNDVTGNWRLTRVSTAKEIQEYALEYYNAYFRSDDEIHAIINFTLNTTNRLAKVTSDILDVAIYDYVIREEHDAKALFSGTLLANYQINTSTGEIEQIPIEPEPEEDAVNPQSNQEDASAITNNQESTNNSLSENPPEAADPNVDMVWLSATGSKYHSIPNCGKMDPNKARQVSKEEAVGRGFEPCSKCY